MESRTVLFCSMGAALVGYLTWQVVREGRDVNSSVGAAVPGFFGDGSSVGRVRFGFGHCSGELVSNSSRCAERQTELAAG